MTSMGRLTMLGVLAGVLALALLSTQPATAGPVRASAPAVRTVAPAAAVLDAAWWWHPGRRSHFYFYGPPYWYDPFYTYPYYAEPYWYRPPRLHRGRSGDSRAIYNLGYRDGLSGAPPHYVKGETPGYKGTCRDDYYAGYYKGQADRYKLGLSRKSGQAPPDQGGQPRKYQPPRHYEPPSAYEKDST